MHCRSTCVSSARAMSLECRSAPCNCQSAVAPKHILPERPLRLPERIVSKMCATKVPYATAGALCLQCQSALCNYQSVMVLGMYCRSAF
ncbi:hypothetical protein AMTRI_Chr08g202320 [Amborella trichopoda]